MKLLKERILKDGKCLEGGILKVDNFINHQMDAKLMMEMAKEIVERFKGTAIDKVVTVEASGIAPAIMVAYLLDVPVVFGKKKVPSTIKCWAMHFRATRRSMPAHCKRYVQEVYYLPSLARRLLVASCSAQRYLRQPPSQDARCA